MRLVQYITELKKKISAAVLMTNGEKFLAVHPTGRKPNEWELPKGIIDDSESPEQAAIREFYEETGQKINISNLKRVGVFPLHLMKNVILYTYSTENLPPIESMKCLSFFQDIKNKTKPEINKWQYMSVNKWRKFIRPEMHKMIGKALK